VLRLYGILWIGRVESALIGSGFRFRTRTRFYLHLFSTASPLSPQLDSDILRPQCCSSSPGEQSSRHRRIRPRSTPLAPQTRHRGRGSVFSLAFSASEPSSRNPDCYTALHGNICFHVSSAPALLCANRVGACSQTVKWKYRRLLDASSGNRIPPSSIPFIPNVALVFALSVTTGKHAALLSTTRR